MKTRISASENKGMVARFNAEIDSRSQLWDVEDIRLSALAEMRRTGQLPTRSSGLVQCLPLRNGRTRWEDIDTAIINGTRGLQNCGCKDLADLFVQISLSPVQAPLHVSEDSPINSEAASCLPVFNDTAKIQGTENARANIDNAPEQKTQRPAKPRVKKLSVNAILSSARATVKNTGVRPSMSSGLILYGPLADQKTTWLHIDRAIRYGENGFKVKGIESLPHLLDLYQIKSKRKKKQSQPPPVRKYTHKEKSNPQYSVEDILDSASATLKATGKSLLFVTRIMHGRLNGMHVTTKALDRAIKYGYFGLENCGYTSLYDLLEKNDMLQIKEIEKPKEKTKQKYQTHKIAYICEDQYPDFSP